MALAKNLNDEIFSISNNDEFENLALQIFLHQYNSNEIYRNYCKLIGKTQDKVNRLDSIPFLPISFFKSHKIISDDSKEQEMFTSSGTSSTTQSIHFVTDIELYKTSFKKSFEHFYGAIEDYCILALLPSYLERKGSSLVYMVDDFIKKSKYDNSGFFINNYQELMEQLSYTAKNGIPTLLIGVSFGLLDYSENMGKLSHPNLIVMETGGMKGKRKEITRMELHNEIKKVFASKSIHSEYGMTELLSQAYSKGSGNFNCPPWMKVTIRKQDDPFSFCNNGEIGGINIIDLANINSCSFIQTEDLGRLNDKGEFEVVGRFDNSEIRGCNLMIG